MTFDPVTGEELYPCLLGSLYGFPSAGRRWFETFVEFILGKDFNDSHRCSFKCRYAPCMYVILHYRRGKGALTKAQREMKAMDLWGGDRLGAKAHLYPDHTVHADGECMENEYPTSGGPDFTAVFMVVHTDDLDVTCDFHDDGKYMFDKLRARFGLKPGSPQFMLGLTRDIVEGGTAMKIGMKGFVETVHSKYQAVVPKKCPAMPYRAGVFLSRTDVTPDDKGIAAYPEYGSLCGSMMWATRMCYPECAIILHYLTRMLTCPTAAAWEAALYCLAYMYGKRDRGVLLRRTEGVPVLRAYTDASNKKDMADTGKAVGGHMVFIGSAPIEWHSSKNPHTGQSAQHNEYMALSRGAKACKYYRMLLEEMGLRLWTGCAPTVISVDNNAALSLAHDDILNNQNRFYEEDTHYIKEAVEKGDADPRHEDTKDNVADLVTKAAARAVFDTLVPYVTGHARRLPRVPDAAHD